MPNVGPVEIIILLVIVLLIFGPKRLPDLGRSLGRGMREFKDSVTGKDEPDKPHIEEPRVVETSQTVTTAVPADEDPARTPGAAKPADVS
ncbi:MAG: sec-independent protein translocase protein TatA [Thermoleophilaceae bacterium]|jgi:sec-independent protein translocase protein TatA|nr:sec-independent protein translocase protein TatA [Thermoleophilaceae bacterium]